MDNLPAPATKLVIKQHFRFGEDRRFWIWLVLGTFYDGEGIVLWTGEEVFCHFPRILAAADDDTASETSQSDRSESEASEAETAISELPLPAC